MESPLAPLIKQLQRLPGIGPRSAERLAFVLLSWSKTDVHLFSSTLVDTHQSIIYCETCFNICITSPCSICCDARRATTSLCVVAYPQDIVALSKTNVYNGLFHVLGGLISPLDGIQPDMLRVQELLSRIQTGSYSEVILAISPTLEGDATSLYLTDCLARFSSISVTTLAFGLPVGAQLDYADPLTLQRSLEQRRRI
ncbi:recombination protein RecR [bacterium]|nr:recombination protein RecR [bacterium]